MAGIAEFWYVVKINFFSFLRSPWGLLLEDFEFLWMPSKKMSRFEKFKNSIHMPTWKKRVGGIWKTGIYGFIYGNRNFFLIEGLSLKKNPRRWLVRYDFFKNWKTATLELQGLSYHKLIDLMTHLLSISTLQTFFPWWKIWKFLRIGWIF